MAKTSGAQAYAKNLMKHSSIELPTSLDSIVSHISSAINLMTHALPISPRYLIKHA